MANIRQLDKRRKSVRNIRKITRTMELIATARFKKAMDRAAAATDYTKRITQIVQDLLEGKAHALTISLVSTTITNGRVRDLPIIVDSMLARNAATGDKVVAQVRSAVALTDEQKSRLAAALAKKTGKQIEVVVDVDPSVLGGIVTQIGDTVIDGSVRQRLSQLRESF